jgi:hypothetical protein
MNIRFMKVIFSFLLEILLKVTVSLALILAILYLLPGLPGWLKIIVFFGSFAAALIICDLLDIRGKILGR